MSARKDAGKSPDEDLRIPYERDKTIRFLSVKDIHMVKANGHYTQLFNGEEELFCPWSISRVEKSLNKMEFIRTHRSFIVGKRRIQGIRRAGDKAYCILGSAEGLEIPISRGRLAEVRELLDLGK
jgi:DNA-binding LytR/AlgR family response regulator